MKIFVRLADGLTRKVMGDADAGACVDSVGCCCPTKGYGQNCYGQCVKQTCRRCA